MKRLIIDALAVLTACLLLPAQPRFRSLWERYCRGVQAIVYVHKQDGEFYIHPFGGKEASDRDLALLGRMGCFTKKSRVRMIAEDDGSVSVEGMDGQNLWREF